MKAYIAKVKKIFGMNFKTKNVFRSKVYKVLSKYIIVLAMKIIKRQITEEGHIN